MHHADAWAVAPAYRFYCILTIMLLFAAGAFLVRGAGLLSRTLGWIAGLGFFIRGILVVTWLVAVAYWKLARVEARYGGGESPQ